MAAGNTGEDWGAAATGVPASVHPIVSVLAYYTKASVMCTTATALLQMLRQKAPDVTAKSPRVSVQDQSLEDIGHINHM